MLFLDATDSKIKLVTCFFKKCIGASENRNLCFLIGFNWRSALSRDVMAKINKVVENINHEKTTSIEIF